MFRVAWSRFCLAAGLTVVAAIPAGSSQAAIEVAKVGELGEIARLDGPRTDSAAVELRFVQEGGPESGQVRVLLTPETRALTAMEARSAAQQAFLVALKEPGLGDELRRITVVVRLAPKSDLSAAEQVFRFQHKGGQDWTILPGE